MSLVRIINGHPTVPYVLMPLGTVIEINRNTDIPHFYEHNGIWIPVNIKAIEEDSVSSGDYKAKAEAGNKANSDLDGRIAKAFKGLAQKAAPFALACAVTLASLPVFGGFFSQNRSYADGPVPTPAPTPVVAAQGYEPNDEFYPLWQKDHLARIRWQEGMENLSRVQLSSAPIKVAVFGDYILCFPNNALPGELNIGGRYVAREDRFVSGCVEYKDQDTHDTQVASIAAAKANNGIGIAGIAGLIPVELYGIDTTDINGDIQTEYVVKGLDWAINNGIHINNFSIGTTINEKSLEDAIVKAWNSEIITVAGSGNNNSDTPVYPASYTNVIGVGNVDENGNRVSGSYGGSNYGHNVKVVAEGRGSASLSPEKGNPQYPYLSVLSGTSAAAPHVSGLSAILMKLYLDQGFSQKESAIKSVYAITSTSSLANNPSYELGYGIINVAKAIESVIGPLPTPTITPTIKIYLPYVSKQHTTGW